ncbi:MAG: hypothetical protein RIC95_14125 [Vicingaceae bacterium]
MTTTLVTFWELEESQFLARLRKVIEESQLLYTASQLKQLLEIENDDEVNWAIQKAIQVLQRLKMDSRLHFKQVYCAQDEVIRIDWRLSSFAYLLVILNCDSEHPIVAKTQVELIRTKIELY